MWKERSVHPEEVLGAWFAAVPLKQVTTSEPATPEFELPPPTMEY